MDPNMTKFNLALNRDESQRKSRIAQELAFPLHVRFEDWIGNLIFVVTGEDSGVGRNGLVNILASCLTAHEFPLAIFEYGLRPGKAFKAHAAAGVKATLVNPLAPDHVAKMIDAIDALDNHIIILTVPRSAWNIFAQKEHLLINCFSETHGFAYLFAALSRRDPMRLMGQHMSWLKANGYPAYQHISCIRAAAYPSAPNEDPAPHPDSLTIPFLSERAREMMFVGEIEPESTTPTYWTFFRTWQELSRGYLAEMQGDFNRFFNMTTHWAYAKNIKPKVSENKDREKKIGK